MEFLRNNNLLSIEFDDGFIFSRVINRKLFLYKPYVYGDVSSGNYTTPFKPQHRNREIIYIDQSTPPRVIHFTVGIKPYSTRLYIKYPSGSAPINSIPNIETASAEVGSDYSYIDGYISPFENPSELAEIFVPPKTHIEFQLYNPEDYTVRPALNIYGMIYKLQLLDPNGSEYERKLIRKMAERSIPSAFATLGDPDNLLSYSHLRDAWEVEPITLSEAVVL